MPPNENEPLKMESLPDIPGYRNRMLDESGGGADPRLRNKRDVLQKLMSNLLGKPGRSFHELANGIKQAISAYKNYAKEWDSLSEMGAGAAIGGAMAPGASMGAKGIKGILQNINERRGATQSPDGGGGPGFPPTGNPNGMPSQARGVPALGTPVPQQPPQQPPQQMPQLSPRPMPPQQMPQLPQQMPIIPPSPQPTPPPLIAGQPQQSSFNRPAPVNRLGIFGN